VSKKANYQQAIRGGIPVCFPQFALAGPLTTNHGFVRTSNEWNVVGVKSDHEEVSITLQINDNPNFREIWDNAFSLQITTKLYYKNDVPVLSQFMQVKNNNEEKSFSFTGALHTYFTANVQLSSIGPFYGMSYDDKVTKTSGSYPTEYLTFKEQTDIIIYNAPLETKILENVQGLKLTIDRSETFPDVVVWNMWSEKAKTMTDFGEDEWLNYLCVETAVIGNPVQLAPGATWTGSHEIIPNLN